MTLKTVMKSTNPILEIYRNCGMLLQSKSESIQKKVQEYLFIVKEAGASIGSNKSISKDIIDGLEMELMTTEQYIEHISE